MTARDHRNRPATWLTLRALQKRCGLLAALRVAGTWRALERAESDSQQTSLLKTLVASVGTAFFAIFTLFFAIIIGFYATNRFGWPVGIAVWVLIILILSSLGARVHVLLSTRTNQLLAAAAAHEKLCIQCAYSLENLNPDPDGCTTCPECGAAWRV